MRMARIGRTIGHVFTVGGFTAFSRVLGLVREMLQSRLIGAGDKPGENDCRLGLQLGAFRAGSGWIVLCTLNVEKGCGTPAADILLRNLVQDERG